MLLGFSGSRRSCGAEACPPRALDAWGWRILFLLGLVVRSRRLSILRRYRARNGSRGKAHWRSHSQETVHDHWRVVAGFVGLSVYSAVTFYIGFVDLVSWLQTADAVSFRRPARWKSTRSAWWSRCQCWDRRWMVERPGLDASLPYAPRKHGRADRRPCPCSGC